MLLLDEFQPMEEILLAISDASSDRRKGDRAGLLAAYNLINIPVGEAADIKFATRVLAEG